MSGMQTLTDNWGLIGHEWAVDLLASRLATGRTGHAYLITGVPGTGRFTLALRFTQAMNCQSADWPFGVPCGHCRACTLIARGVHPDVQVIRADGRSIKIEAIRDLQRDLTVSPIEGRYRVAIIEEMQTATDQAADALLKTLEEPPASTRLILTADAAENVRPTIVSRCQVVPLRPVRPQAIAAALMQRYDLPADEANTLARLAAGRPGWAITAVDDENQLARRREMIDMLLDVLRAGRTERFNLSERIARDNSLPLLLETWQSWWRDLLLTVEGSSVAPVNADRWEELRALTYDVTSEEVRRALLAIRRTMDALSKNANARLALDVMFLDMPYL